MKTIKEWLETLPEPYRSQALENMNKNNSDEKMNSLSNTLGIAFVWGNTKQGSLYWNDVYESAKKAEKIGGKINNVVLLNRTDVTVKTVNEEAVKKSNRQIAEEIFAEIAMRVKTTDLETNVSSIETILNKYFNR